MHPVNKTIFNNSLPEVEKGIIYFSDDQSLLALSQVSRFAQEVINNPLFEQRFFAQYPHLLEFKEKLFVTLCMNHKNNCWKMVCDVFSRGSFQTERHPGYPGYASNSSNHRINMNFPFFAGSIPCICDSLEAQKMQLNTRINALCGDYFEDPKGKLDQAWKAAKAKEQIFLPMQNEFREIADALEAVHSLEEIRSSIFPALCEQGNIFFPSGEISEWILAATDEEIAPFKREYLPLYARFCGHMQKASLFQNEFEDFEKLEEAYNRLEEEKDSCVKKKQEIGDNITLLTSFFPGSIEIVELTKDFDKYLAYFAVADRKQCLELKLRRSDSKSIDMIIDEHIKYIERSALESCERSLQDCNNILSFLTPHLAGNINLKMDLLSFFNEHKKFINDELCIAKEFEYALTQFSNLRKCHQLIKKAIKEPTDELHEQIRHSINACSLEDLTYIWGKLYKKCAGERQEDRWSEIHFPEFLPTLQKLVSKCNEKYEDSIENMNNRLNPSQTSPLM